MYDRAKLIKAIETHNLEVDKRSTLDKLVDAVRDGTNEAVLEGCKVDTGYDAIQKDMAINFSQTETLEQKADKAAYVIVNIVQSYESTEPNYVILGHNLRQIKVERGVPVKLERCFYHSLKEAVITQPHFVGNDGRADPLATSGVILREVPRYPYQIVGVA